MTGCVAVFIGFNSGQDYWCPSLPEALIISLYTPSSIMKTTQRGRSFCSVPDFFVSQSRCVVSSVVRSHHMGSQELWKESILFGRGALMSTYCCRRGSGFISQHPYDRSQLTINSNFRGPMPSSGLQGLLYTCGTHIHMQVDMQTNKFLKIFVWDSEGN